MSRSVLAALLLILAGSSIRADEVTFKNGDRLSGVIKKSDEKNLLIKTEFAGDVSIKWDAVAAIVSTQPLHLTLKDSQTVVGVVTTSGEKFEVATRETGPVYAAKSSVVSVRDDIEQTAYDQQIERLRHPHLTDFWSGVFDTGLSLTRGNSDSTSFALASKVARTTERDKITAYSTAIYTKSAVNGVSSTTAHAIRGGIRGDLNISERWFVFGFTDLEYDQFQGLDLRNVLGGGLGYHVIKTKLTVFDLFGGGSFNQEYYALPFNPPNPATSRKSGEILVGETLSTKLGARTTFAEQFSLFPNISDTGRYRMQFDVTAATKLKNWLSWQITYSDRYVSDPLAGLKKNDMLLSTGLRLTFGKGVF